jgi:hypothetical protein
MACDDGDACTTDDKCNGLGACKGTLVPVQYIVAGSGPSTQYPVGNAEGACILVAKYCSTTGPLNVPPPASPAGYTTGPSVPAGCDANDFLANVPWPAYQKTFCKSCAGNCATACP